jgi:hypothetical protein
MVVQGSLGHFGLICRYYALPTTARAPRAIASYTEIHLSSTQSTAGKRDANHERPYPSSKTPKVVNKDIVPKFSGPNAVRGFSMHVSDQRRPRNQGGHVVAPSRLRFPRPRKPISKPLAYLQPPFRDCIPYTYNARRQLSPRALPLIQRFRTS